MISRETNKRGQLGKLIAIFPIMLLIFVIMGIFIFLAASFSVKGVASGSKGSPVFYEGVVTRDDLMLMPISLMFEKKISDESGTRNEPFTLKMRVLDAVVLYLNNSYPAEASAGGKPFKEVLNNGLEKIMLEDSSSIASGISSCLFLRYTIADSSDWGLFAMMRQGREIINAWAVNPDLAVPVGYRGLARDLSLYTSDGRQVQIIYYYGRCPL